MYNKFYSDNTMEISCLLETLAYEVDHNLDELSLSHSYHLSSPITHHQLVVAAFAQVQPCIPHFYKKRKYMFVENMYSL